MEESSGCLSKGDIGSGNGDGLFSVLRSCMRTKGDFFPLSSTGLFICVTARRRCAPRRSAREISLLSDRCQTSDDLSSLMSPLSPKINCLLTERVTTTSDDVIRYSSSHSAVWDPSLVT
ncbi:unnamed protein product [Leuciscus chuanchicus]